MSLENFFLIPTSIKQSGYINAVDRCFGDNKQSLSPSSLQGQKNSQTFIQSLQYKKCFK